MKTSHKKHKYTSEQLAEILYNRMFTKWYSGNDKIFQNAECYCNLKHCMSFIIQYLNAGADVRTGYTRTSIKGVRNYYVFISGFAD